MKNVISIRNNAFYTITNESGANAVIVQFMDITNAICIEVYKGNEFFGVIPVRILDGNTAATLPSEVFTGNNVHFRLVKTLGFSQFYHIVYDPNYDFTLKQYDQVVCGNLKINGVSTVVGGSYNTYDDLAVFKNLYLRNYNYGDLRSKSL